jgi:hypothetical protein
MSNVSARPARDAMNKDAGTPDRATKLSALQNRDDIRVEHARIHERIHL